MTALPAGLAQSFRVAAAELGMCGASWLFVEEIARGGGAPAVEAIRDQLGRAYPVLDAVARSWLVGARRPSAGVAALLPICAGASRVLVVGLEAHFIDELAARLDGPRIALVTHSTFDVDWERVLANLRPRVEATTLSTFQRWAGRNSVLLTFTYGTDGSSTHVDPTWLRVIGPDVRTQFRAIVGWDVLQAPMFVYPRWLVQVPTADFSHFV